jgi:hypothetical protein
VIRRAIQRRRLARRVVCRVLVIFCLLSIAACNDEPSSISCLDNVAAGEPVIQITAVTDSITGTPVHLFALTHFRPEWPGMTVAFLLENVPGTHATPVGNILLCHDYCGFGSLEAEYQFRISAPDYESQTLTVIGHFSGLAIEGCRTLTTDGTKVAVKLRPLIR